MKKFKAIFLSFTLLLIVWLFLTSFSLEEVIVGGIASGLLTLFFHKKLEILGDLNLNPKALIYLVIYLFVFSWELLLSNLDVMKRVISPSLPINPGIIKVKTKLKSRLGRIFLANSITLTPGTLTVETKGEDFYIHWIDVKSKKSEHATEAIVKTFEKYLEVIFG